MSPLETLVGARASAVIYAITDELHAILDGLGVHSAIDAREVDNATVLLEVRAQVDARLLRGEPVVLLTGESPHPRLVALVQELVNGRYRGPNGRSGRESAVAVLTTARRAPSALAALCAADFPARAAVATIRTVAQV